METIKQAGGGLTGKSLYDQIIATRYLYRAWHLFKKGKTTKPDVVAFSKNLALEIDQLRSELSHHQYVHSPYVTFYVHDPKLRKINKACVRDRVVHHALFAKLYSIFDSLFIFDSYSCRLAKGTHAAVRRLQVFFRKSSKNNTKNCWVLKCDVKKFFDSIDQEILMKLIAQRVKDTEVLWLISEVLKSLPSGLPLGNITSQLFANIYLNELDQFIKHELRVKYHIRYCDDFVILHCDKLYLEALIPKISIFLQERLKLSLHPQKITIRKYRQGIDFLGYIVFPKYSVLRVKTKKRMLRKLKLKTSLFVNGDISENSFGSTLSSYLGMLSHCNGYKTQEKVTELLTEIPQHLLRKLVGKRYTERKHASR